MQAQQQAEKESEIALLKAQLESFENLKKMVEKDNKIAELNSTIAQSESKLQVAVMEEQKKSSEALQRWLKINFFGILLHYALFLQYKIKIHIQIQLWHKQQLQFALTIH